MKHCFIRVQENLHYRKFYSGILPTLMAMQKIIDFLLRRGKCPLDTYYFPPHVLGVVARMLERYQTQ